MDKKIKIGVVGLGKMGLSHFAMINAHPKVETVACDGSGFLVDVLKRQLTTPIHKDYEELLQDHSLDAVVIATPSRFHAPMVEAALQRGLHVFCEKPFCLDWRDSQRLTDLAVERSLVAQVGYHYRYVGAFREMKRIVDSGALGEITHILAEAYGPVVLRPKRATWRTQKEEGGGCLFDYAAHPLNLLNWFFGVPDTVPGAILSSVFSSGIDDQVMAMLGWNGGPTAQLSVNWSDESHRKMTTRVSMIGTNGKVFADRQECQVYLRSSSSSLPDYGEGWSVRYTTDLTEDQWFYLRGEEYAAQLNDFVGAISSGNGKAVENDFASACDTDRTMAMLTQESQKEYRNHLLEAPTARSKRKRWWFF